MGQTMAEKLFSRHNLEKTPVQAGDMLEARMIVNSELAANCAIV